MYMYTYMRMHVRMDVFRLGFSLPHTRAHVFVDLAWPPQLKWLAIRHFLAQVCMYACPGTTVDSMRYNVLTYIHVWYQWATTTQYMFVANPNTLFPPPFFPPPNPVTPSSNTIFVLNTLLTQVCSKSTWIYVCMNACYVRIHIDTCVYIYV